MTVLSRSHCSALIPPPGTPGDITFSCCPGNFITLFLPCPAPLNHFNPFLSSAPPFLHFIFPCLALFYRKHISSEPEAARRGGSSGRTIWPAHNITNPVLTFSTFFHHFWVSIQDPRKILNSTKYRRIENFENDILD